MSCMNKPIKFLMIGGFLGAGKTTAMARLASHYAAQGLRVGLVTNDQATDLVDTYALKAQGFLVGEIPGACFCCSFNQLIATLKKLGEGNAPDVIIAEPVGSCTDLVATVIEPLRQQFPNEYTVGPLAVLLKPEHGTKILNNEQKAGFSPKAAYIFLKQIEEADIVAVNKVDKLSAAERDALLKLVAERFPQKTVLAISARDGTGFEQLIDAMEQPAPADRTPLEIDYDTYADGEAELGWLNAQLEVADHRGTFALDEMVHSILSGLAQRLNAADAETAHVKVLGQSDTATAIGNLVASSAECELSQRSSAQVAKAQVVLNARVATAPELLEAMVRETLTDISRTSEVAIDVQQLQCFQPGRPVPTFRIS
jgi:Ni2+-binding GTPase involved in maturation of urease and hydrogenase